MIKTFPASLEKLYEMLKFVKEQALAAGFEEANVAKIELATEEALVNIISYGYPHKNGIIEIHCSLPERLGLRILITDRGLPYNPLMNARKFNPSASLEERSVGGYGIFFILKIMDEVDYHRENNNNVLILTKYLN